jgi:hypothetical protein
MAVSGRVCRGEDLRAAAGDTFAELQAISAIEE